MKIRNVYPLAARLRADLQPQGGAAQRLAGDESHDPQAALRKCLRKRDTLKTTPPQRDFGQQVTHIAGGNVGNLRFLGGKATPPVIDRNATSKTEAIKAMDTSFDFGAALINEFTDQTLMDIVQTNAFLGPSSRARVIWFLLGHTWDIYGQMVVVLAPQWRRAAGEPASDRFGGRKGPPEC